MKYLFLAFRDESEPQPTPENWAVERQKWQGFEEEWTPWAYETRGTGLQPSTTATVVSVRDGKTITTDGPFVDTKEQLAGFYLVDCPDLDQAIELAAKVPWAMSGHVEVRPIWESA